MQRGVTDGVETAQYTGARVYARETAEVGTRKREIGVPTARTLHRKPVSSVSRSTLQ